MGANSHIEWTEATWNPLTGCTRVSRGCDNCYAARQAAGRLKNTAAYSGLAVITPSGRAAFNGHIRLLPDRLEQPLRWRKPRRVFVNSMSDLFHPDVPFTFVDRVYDVMCRTPQHTYQILTKRPELMAAFYGATEGGYPLRPTLPNVWIGTSVEDQVAADERIPHLLRTPAAVRFLSCEPLLGRVDLRAIYRDAMDEAHDVDCLNAGIHWVIVGGESGPGARPMSLRWARGIVEQCQVAGVSVFVKQLGRLPCVPSCADVYCDHPDCRTDWLRLQDRKGGDPSEWPADLRIREMPEAACAR